MMADAAPTIATSATDGLSLVVVDRNGKMQRTIPANRPWTPRFSPNGQRIAYGAYGPGRTTSDVWITDLGADATQRLTDDDADSNDPQWSPDGSSLAYSISAPGGKDIAWKSLEGGVARVLATRPGAQFPNDWLRDGSALLVTDEAGEGHDILVQPANGSAGKQYTASVADETSARISPDEHWVAYTSNESGRSEVYLDSYPRRGQRMLVSKDGGFDPVWRGDGRELYYWQNNALVALPVGSSNGKTPPSIGAATVLFHAGYHRAINTMYDAAPDGSRFVIVQDR